MGGGLHHRDRSQPDAAGERPGMGAVLAILCLDPARCGVLCVPVVLDGRDARSPRHAARAAGHEAGCDRRRFREEGGSMTRAMQSAVWSAAVAGGTIE